MELIALYRELDEPRRIDLGFPTYTEEWAPFHESDAHKISVFGGRGTGKTYNLLLRMLRSEHSCYLFTHSNQSLRDYSFALQELIQKAPAVDLSDSSIYSDDTTFTFSNGREIRILPMRPSRYRGRRFENKEIYIDEFESFRNLADFLDDMRLELFRAKRIVCVGSMRTELDTEAKRWFNESDVKYFIDAQRYPPTRGHMRCEYLPSELRFMIEHLPPRGILIEEYSYNRASV